MGVWRQGLTVSLNVFSVETMAADLPLLALFLWKTNGLSSLRHISSVPSNYVYFKNDLYLMNCICVFRAWRELLELIETQTSGLSNQTGLRGTWKFCSRDVTRYGSNVEWAQPDPAWVPTQHTWCSPLVRDWFQSVLSSVSLSTIRIPLQDTTREATRYVGIPVLYLCPRQK